VTSRLLVHCLKKIAMRSVPPQRASLPLYDPETELGEDAGVLHDHAVSFVEFFGVGRQVAHVELGGSDSSVEAVLEAGFDR
jgi:hypothetical protein